MFQVEGITRYFGTVLANNGVSLTLNPGEVVGLLGENGAGKSTLLAIAAGYMQPDAGGLRLDGTILRQRTPSQAIRNGIGLVHQHLSVIPALTTGEQLRLSGWRLGEPLPDVIAGFDLKAHIESLSMGERQRLEIAKALLRDPQILLLDEPTSILAPSEVLTLFDTIEKLAESGLGIILVSHKLREVQQVANRLIIMRAGLIAGEIDRDDSGTWPIGTEDRALSLMFGWNDPETSPNSPELPTRNSIPGVATPSLRDPQRDSQVGETVLHVDRLTVHGTSNPLVRNATFQLDTGKLYTVVGIDGQGQRELALAIAGQAPAEGSLSLDCTPIEGMSARQRSQLGIGLLVDDRLGEAAIGSLTLTQNVALKQPRPLDEVRRGIMRWPAIQQRTRNLIANWQVTPSNPESHFGTLSGGNMQRLLAARELDRNPRLLIAINPVHGLDWQTTQLLWKRLRQRCAEGGTVLVFTGDLDEALAESDQIAVMTQGVLGPFNSPDAIDRRDLASQMVNGW